jgi:ABC-type transport system involved in multi-copper enzyme maturation permease subunit
MIPTLLFRYLRQHAFLLGSLSLGLVLFEWAIVWVAAIIDLGPGFQDLLGAFLPRNVVESLLGQFGFATFAGALSFGFQHPLTLTAAVAMVVVMSTLPAAEREAGLLDLILARPLPRERYLAAALIGVVFTALLSPLALLAGCAVGLTTVDAPQPVSWTHYLPSAAGLFFLLLVIGAFGLLFASQSRRRGQAVALLVGLTLVWYWLDFMGDYWAALETARLISPFHYFEPASAATEGLAVGHVVLLFAFSVLPAVGAFLNFRRQDL